MNRILYVLLFGIAGVATPLMAATHVGVGVQSFDFELCAQQGSCGGLSGFAGELDSLVREQFHAYRNVVNSYAYEVVPLTAKRDRLTIDIELFSAFRPAFSGVDRFGNPFSVPDTWFDTTFDAQLAIRLPERTNVKLRIPGSIIDETPSFNLTFAGESAHYATDLADRSLIRPTNFMSDPATLNGVFDFTDSFVLNAGTYLLEFDMESAIGANHELLDGQVQIILDFVVPEPTSGLLLLIGSVLCVGRLATRS